MRGLGFSCKKTSPSPVQFTKIPSKIGLLAGKSDVQTVSRTIRPHGRTVRIVNPLVTWCTFRTVRTVSRTVQIITTESRLRVLLSGRSEVQPGRSGLLFQ